MSISHARLCRAVTNARDAAAFLTRLVPPRAGVDAAALTKSVPWFPVVGLGCGLICALAAYAMLALLPGSSGTFFISGTLAELAAKATKTVADVTAASASATTETTFALSSRWSPLHAGLAAWVWLLVAIWSSRGLHWDGLADLGDACGSATQGERFWAVLRDSRMGAFGALSLLLVFSGQLLGLAVHIQSEQWLPLILAPAWGGACAIWCAGTSTPYDSASLGGLAHAGARPAIMHAWAYIALVLCFGLWLCGLPLWQACALPLGQYWIIGRFARIAREHGGMSGDFIGAAIETGRLWFLLLTL